MLMMGYTNRQRRRCRSGWEYQRIIWETRTNSSRLLPLASLRNLRGHRDDHGETRVVLHCGTGYVYDTQMRRCLPCPKGCVGCDNHQACTGPDQGGKLYLFAPCVDQDLMWRHRDNFEHNYCHHRFKDKDPLINKYLGSQCGFYLGDLSHKITQNPFGFSIMIVSISFRSPWSSYC